MAGFCEHSKEPLDFLKNMGFLDQLNDCQLLKDCCMLSVCSRAF
jgi:hypothetical protein